LTTHSRCSLAALESSLLRHPLTVLNLTVRASNCLSHLASIAELLEHPESQLMHQRHFGRTSLADVRRRVVHFCVDHLGVGATHPIRVALYDPHPSVTAIWNTPPQARTLAEVVDDLLDVLSRPEELRAAGAWEYSARTIGPPRPIRLDRMSLGDVIDSCFQPLRRRERRMIELRFGSRCSSGATLAEIGAQFGLTRERVRQITQASLQRLAAESERHRRGELTRWIEERIQRVGGLIREDELASALRGRVPPPHPDCRALLRTLLDVEPGFITAGRGVWALATVSMEQVETVREGFRSALCGARQPLHRDALLAGFRADTRVDGRFLEACLNTDERIRCCDGDQYGLAEWEWLMPHTLDDYVYLALRAAGRPRHYLWVTDYVNTLVPRGSELRPREIHAILLDRTERFVRTREGTYGLAEWKQCTTVGDGGGRENGELEHETGLHAVRPLATSRHAEPARRG
jgi:hypothetical protein